MRHKAGRITRELPPRARRIPAQLLHAYRIRGTTSACAENTPCSTSAGSGMWNYLRVRGEYSRKCTLLSEILELPPRARRIHLARNRNLNFRGTTSACAENTGGVWSTGGVWRNYLRVRGEYRKWLTAKSSISELPPRARRIREIRRSNFMGGGTTSACAENTQLCGPGSGYPGNYLRVRGEYEEYAAAERAHPELPPRARRILPGRRSFLSHQGTTSACAENTYPYFSGSGATRNYLRVRGEYTQHSSG